MKNLQFVLKIRLSGKQGILQVKIIQRFQIDIIFDLKDPVTEKLLRLGVITENIGSVHDTLDRDNPLQLEIPDFLKYTAGVFRGGPVRRGQDIDEDIRVQKNLNSQHAFSKDIPTWDQQRILLPSGVLIRGNAIAGFRRKWVSPS